MDKIKRLIKAFTPPIFLSLFNRVPQEPTKIEEKSIPIWSGNFNSWQEAKSKCSGYESDTILEKCKQALLKVKNGEAVYERDSFIFDKIQYSWGLLAGLQKAALESKGKLNVLDLEICLITLLWLDIIQTNQNKNVCLFPYLMLLKKDMLCVCKVILS